MSDLPESVHRASSFPVHSTVIPGRSSLVARIVRIRRGGVSRTLLAQAVAICLLAALGSGAVAAQVSPVVPDVSGRRAEEAAEVRVYAYTFQNKSATEALPLVQPLLTRQGSVEIQPEENTLVVRDTVAALGRIVPALRAFDRPPQGLRIEVMIVRAGTRPAVSPGSESLPPWLEKRLRGLLRWNYYTLLARSVLDSREDQEVTHEVGGLYQLSFRPGTLQSGNQIKLQEFRIWHAGETDAPPLLEATLNLWLGKPKVLGLANSETSDRALMVVLTCERLDGGATSHEGGRSSGRSKGGR